MHVLILIVSTNLFIALISTYVGLKINTYRNKKKCIECLTDMSMKLREYKEFKTFDVYDRCYGKIAK